MATILKQPGTLAISGNISDIFLSSSTPIDFSITNSDNTETYLSESYDPDSLNQITIRLRDVLPTLLKVNVPTTDVFEQVNAAKTFHFVVNETVIETLVVKAGVDADINAATFLKTNWLTWQNQQKRVKYMDAEWLSYFAVEAVDVKVKAYFKEDNPQIITLTSLTAGKQYSLNMNYGYLSDKFAQQPVYFDVWTENGSATRLSFVQRYVLHKDYNEFEDCFVFENTLGGLDTVRFTGEKEESNVFETESALVDEVTTDYDIDFERIFEINTGYFADEHTRQWTNDFFNSLQRYLVTDDGLKSISVSKPKAKSVKGELSSYDFKFALSRQTPYLNLPRTDQLPDVVEVVDPESTLFFLAPRLNEFQIATICDELIFPVQIPFVKEWKQLSFGAVKAALIEQVANTIVVPSSLDESQLQSYLTTNKYVTQDWIAEQNFETNLEGYATEQWVTQKNYLTQHQDLSAYAKTNDVWTKAAIANLDKITIDANGNLLVPGDVISFADMGGDYGSVFDNLPLASISSKGIAQFNSTHFTVENGLVSVRDSVVGLDENALATYLTNNSYATQDWVSQQDYLTQHQDLTGYATEQWVTQKNYLTQHQDLSAYAKTNDVWTKAAIANLDKITIDANGNLLVPGDVISFADMGGDYGSIFDNLPLASISSKGIAQFNSTHFTVENGLVSSIVSGGVVTETDPTVPTHVKNILSAQITHWDAAYNWGDHASQGYASGSHTHTKLQHYSLGVSGSLNTAVTDFGFERVYRFHGGVTDVPSFANDGLLRSYSWSGGLYVIQEAKDIDTGRHGFRVRSGAGVWGAWKENYHSGNSNLSTIDWTAKNGIFYGNAIIEGTTDTYNSIRHRSTDRKYGITLNPVSNGSAQQIYTDYWGSGTAQALVLGTYTNRANQLYLQTNGNVGIGKAPGYKLEVAGDIKSNGDVYLYEDLRYTAANFYLVSAAKNRSNYIIYPIKHRAVTDFGYLEYGAMNSSYCHFLTDRLGFYFNSLISVAGEIRVYNTNTKLSNGLLTLNNFTINRGSSPLNTSGQVVGTSQLGLSSTYASDHLWLYNKTDNGESSGIVFGGHSHGIRMWTACNDGKAFQIYDEDVPTVPLLTVDGVGNLTAKSDVTAYSDMRVKRYVKPLTNVLSNLDRLSAFYYTRTDVEDKISLHIGSSAQAIQKLYPEFITVLDDDRKTLTLDYSKFGAAMAVQGLKETKIWMSAKDREIAQLKDRVSILEKQLNIA